MGINQTKSALKSIYSKDNTCDPDHLLQKAFDAEGLRIKEYIDAFWESKFDTSHLDWSNIQKNKKPADVEKELKEVLMKEKFLLPNLPVNEVLKDGVFSQETYKEFFPGVTSSSTENFSKAVNKSINVLFYAYMPKILKTMNETSSVEAIAKYFDSLKIESTTINATDMRLKLFIDFLEDLSELKADIKEDTLDFLLSSSQYLRPMALYGETSEHFLLDSSFDRLIDYLIKLALKEEGDLAKKAFKVVLNLSIAKGSVQNLLDFVVAYREVKAGVDINHELNLFKTEFVKLSLTFPVESQLIVNSKLWNFKLGSEILGDLQTENPSYSVTTDGTYNYVFSSQGYICKVGSGYNNTLLGNVYLSSALRTGEKGTIAFIDGVIYFRSSNTDPNPLVKISPETLQEMESVIEYDTKQTNAIWVETKKQDFEFPKGSAEKNEVIEKIVQEGTPCSRLNSKSPMTTDGRYIYIFSKWFDKNEDVKQSEDDEDSEEAENKDKNKEKTVPIYGIDVYDPLNAMKHYKSVIFEIPEEKSKDREINLLQDNTLIYTNGNIFIVGGFKFSVETGECLDFEEIPSCEPKRVAGSYDLENNILVTFNRTLDGSKENTSMSTYFNISGKPILEYPSNHPSYVHCSLDTLISYSEELLNLKDLKNEISDSAFSRENTLRILGIKKAINPRDISISDDSTSLDLHIRGVQCYILSTIAKLADYHGQVPDIRSAKTEEERGHILAKACKRPYCVKLEAGTFNKLISFIDSFSSSFFAKGGKPSSKEELLECYSLLSSVKILTTNLKCLTLSKIDMENFIDDKANSPFKKVKEFVFKVFDMYFSASKPSEILTAVFRECRTILSVSVNTLYTEFDEIVSLLETKMDNFDSDAKDKEMVLAVLEWVSNEHNIKSVMKKPSDLNSFFRLFGKITNWETTCVVDFLSTLTGISSFKGYKDKIQKKEKIAHDFLKTVFDHIITILSKKLLNDNYEDIEEENLLVSFTSFLLESVNKILVSLCQFAEEGVDKMLDFEHSEAVRRFKEYSSLNKEEKALVKKIPEEPAGKDKFVFETFPKLWKEFLQNILEENRILKMFNFTVDTLKIFSSNFVVALKLSDSFNEVIGLLDKLNNTTKRFDQKEEENEGDDYKEVVFECQHPCPMSQNTWHTAELEGEEEIFIDFDPQCSLRTNCAYIQIYTDQSSYQYAFQDYNFAMNENNWPTETLTWTGNPLSIYFYSDGCNTVSNNWGYRITVHNGKKGTKVAKEDVLITTLRGVVWLSSKCASKLIDGNFSKVFADEDENKYNSILSSKLLSGGLEHSELMANNDKITSNMLELLNESELVDSFSKTKATELMNKNTLSAILEGGSGNSAKLMELINKKFLKTNIGGSVGGEPANRIVRAAFAVILKHSGSIDDFVRLVELIEESEKPLELEDVQDSPEFRNMLKKWSASNRMRTWLVGKRKNVDETIEKVKQDKEEIEKESAAVMKKIIESVVIKAKFLLKLNTAPAFTSDFDKRVKKDSATVIRKTSSKLSGNKEEDWKSRLNNWKAMGMSKNVLRSVEEEANMNFNSVTTSTLVCLQSSVSSKKLYNKLKMSAIRAKCREHGLVSLRNLLTQISNEVIIKDVLAWFCNSLRNDETKICSYLDNLEGCGKDAEENVQNRFEAFFSVMLEKIGDNDDNDLLICLIDAFMWRFSSIDFPFLAKSNLFFHLWGSYNDRLKEVWGKQLAISEIAKVKPGDSGSIIPLTNQLLGVFEVLTNICLEKAVFSASGREDSMALNRQVSAVTAAKFPSLEKKQSVLDDKSADSILIHVLDILFGEIGKAVDSYETFRGVSYNLWKQYLDFLQEEERLKKEKGPKEEAATGFGENDDNINNTNQAALSTDERREIVEELESYLARDTGDVKDDVKNEQFTEKTKDRPFSCHRLDLIKKYGDVSQNVNMKLFYLSKAEIEKYLTEQHAEVYDSNFLNRLLNVIYRCSVQDNDLLVLNLGNPFHLSSLLKLLILSATPNQILICKILQNLVPKLPVELLEESIDFLVVDPSAAHLKEKLGSEENLKFVKFVVHTVSDIRSRIWTPSYGSEACYLVSCELIKVIRNMWETEMLKDSISGYFSEKLANPTKDILIAEIAYCCLGGDFVGLSQGAHVKVNNDVFRTSIDFGFLKNDFTEHFSEGNVTGFGDTIDEGWNFSKDDKKEKKKDKKELEISIMPKTTESLAAIMLHDSISNEAYKIKSYNPQFFTQYVVETIQSAPNFKEIKLSDDILHKSLEFVFSQENTSESVNLKVNACRMMTHYFNSVEGVEFISRLNDDKLKDYLKSLKTHSLKLMQYSSNFLNAETLEEAKFRLIDKICTEEVSVKEIPKVSIKFTSPDNLFIRLYKKDISTVVFQLQGYSNHTNLLKMDNFYDAFGVVVFVGPEEVKEHCNKQTKLIVTHSFDLTTLESDINNIEQCIAILTRAEFEYITERKQALEEAKTESNNTDIKGELLEYGFEENLINKFISKSENTLDLVNMILEFKENNVAEEGEEIKDKEIPEEEGDANEFDKEEKNTCFECKDDNQKEAIPDYFEEINVQDEVDDNIIFNKYKGINAKLVSYYSRRVSLAFFSELLLSSRQELLFEIFSPAEMMTLLKLLTHEGLFINNSKHASTLLLSIKACLKKIYSSTGEKGQAIKSKLIEDSFLSLDQVCKANPKEYSFFCKDEANLTQKPYIFFSVWNFLIAIEDSGKELDWHTTVDLLAGLVLKIKENKELRWFVLEVVFNILEKLYHSQDKELLISMADKSFKELPSISKLRTFLDESLIKETKDNLSKRSQMITELLILVEDLEQKIRRLSGTNESTSLQTILNTSVKRDNFSSELLTTFEMMKNFFNNDYLRYLAWIELNPEIVNQSKLSFESSHLYSKSPHSYLIYVPNTNALEVSLSDDTLLDQGETLTFALDRNAKFPVECITNRKQKNTFTINSAHTFVHFPAGYINEVYSFGMNSNGKLGHSSNSAIFTPKLVESLVSHKIKKVVVGEACLFVLTEEGQLLTSGTGNISGQKQPTSNFSKASLPGKISSDCVNDIDSDSGGLVINYIDNTTCSMGQNSYGALGQEYNNPVGEMTPMGFTKPIKAVAVSGSNSYFITVEGEMYGCGSADYYQMLESNTTRINKVKKLSIPKGMTAESVSCGQNYVVMILKEVLTGTRKLYSSGDNTNGKTGHPKDTSSHEIKEVEMEEAVDFKAVRSSKGSSFAITSDNKLYCWGTNTTGQLGLGHYNHVYGPTKVDFFNDYEIVDVSCSEDHTLFLVKKDGLKAVFACGSTNDGVLGETITQKAEKKNTCPTPIKVSFFDGKVPEKICAGNRTSVVICKPLSLEELRGEHKTKCTGCAVYPIKKEVSVPINEVSALICPDCAILRDTAEFTPSIVIKSPIDGDYTSTLKEAFSKDGDKLKEIGKPSDPCCVCLSELKNTFFITLCAENKNKQFCCSTCINNYSEKFTNAKVWLKTRSDYENLEILHSENFYKNSISYGYKFSVTPKMNEEGSKEVISKFSDKFADFKKDINSYNHLEVYEQFVDMMNNTAQKDEKSIFSYVMKDLVFKKGDLSVRTAIEKASPETLKKIFILLKLFNLRVKELLSYIDFSKTVSDNQRLSAFFNKITPFVFWDVKNNIIKYYLEKTSADYECKDLKINRMRARKFIEKKKVDHTGEYTIFGQVYQFLKNQSFKIYRKNEAAKKNSNKMFNANFIGEASIDVGGPYRECLTQAMTELQSDSLPLLIPTPNQKSDSGQFREKWTLNPSAKTADCLDMLKILGGMMGYAIRTGEFLNLDLPSIFWKSLLETRIEKRDLEYIDRFTVQCLEDMRNLHKKDVNARNFTNYVEEKFVTCLSDGTEVELIPGGSQIDVTFDTRLKYCDLIEKVRIEEAVIQTNAVKCGLEKVIPLGLLKLLSWKELETLVCGKSILDVELLKQNTVYRGCSEGDNIPQWFWKILDEFSAEERSMYLRFVWGRSRLPLTSKGFNMKHRIEIQHHNNPDYALPTAHTCFFSIEIPKYSSCDIMKEKLKYAILNCQAIDTDGQAMEVWQDED